MINKLLKVLSPGQKGVIDEEKRKTLKIYTRRNENNSVILEEDEEGAGAGAGGNSTKMLKPYTYNANATEFLPSYLRQKTNQ
jgi:hypothetical protein